MLKTKAERNRKKRQRARTNNSEKHGKAEQKGRGTEKTAVTRQKSNRKKGKGRAQITARSTESRTKRARHRKNSSNTRRRTAVSAEASKDECGERTTKRRNDVQRKGRKRWQRDTDLAQERGGMRQTKPLNSIFCCHREQNSATITQRDGMKRVKKRRKHNIFIYAERQQKNIEYVQIHVMNTTQCVGTDKKEKKHA